MLKRNSSILRTLGLLAIIMLTTAAKKGEFNSGPCEDLPGPGNCMKCKPDNQNCFLLFCGGQLILTNCVF